MTENPVALRRQAEAILDGHPPNESDRTQMESELDACLYGDHIAIGAAGDNADELLDDLASTPFLAAQARYHHGFRGGSRDLESWALPAVIRLARDDPERAWPRFLHLALVAANLRGLAESLSEDGILEALAAHGQQPLALDIASQLVDTGARARARGVILAATPETAAAESGTHDQRAALHRIAEDLNRSTDLPSARRAQALLAVAGSVGGRLEDRWQAWLADLGPPADAVLWALAKNRMGRALSEATGPREARKASDALAAIGDREMLRLVAPPYFVGPGAHLPMLASLEERFGGEPWLLDSHLARIARDTRAGGSAGAAPAAWRQLTAAAKRPLERWDARTIRHGEGLWTALDRDTIDTLDGCLEDAEARVALRLSRLTAAPEAMASEDVLSAIDALDDEATEARWMLRWLTALPPSRAQYVAARLPGIGRWLLRIGDRVTPDELGLLLDLVARHRPRDLVPRLFDILWASWSGPPTLLGLAWSARSRRLLEHLREHAARAAAWVSSSEAEGFATRRDLLLRIAIRLARDWGDAGGVARVQEDLLPGDEERALRAAVCRILLEERDTATGGMSTDHRHLAEEMTRGLEDPLLRFSMGLRLVEDGDELARRLRPAVLYRVAAGTDLRDELALLRLLQQPAVRPRELARAMLAEIRSPERRVLGLIELAHAAIAHQRRHYDALTQDRTAVFPLVLESLEGVTSVAWRLGLTPELAALGAELGNRRAAAEVQEALLALFRHGDLPWSLRREVCGNLLSRLEVLILGASDSRRRGSVGARALVKLLRRLVRRVDKAEEGEQRRRWCEVFPRLVAAIERLPPAVQARLGDDPWRIPAPELLARWPWLEENDAVAVRWSCAAGQDRQQRAAELIDGAPAEGAPGLEVRTLMVLLSRDAPEQAIGLTERLPEDQQGETGETLLAEGWLDATAAVAMAETLGDSPHGRRTFLHRLPRQEPCLLPWLNALGEVVVRGELHLEDPRILPFWRHLRQLEPTRVREPLARAVIRALETGGRVAGERVLRLFLATLLTVGDGDGDDSVASTAVVSAAIQRARTIPEPAVTAASENAAAGAG